MSLQDEINSLEAEVERLADENAELRRYIINKEPYAALYPVNPPFYSFIPEEEEISEEQWILEFKKWRKAYYE